MDTTVPPMLSSNGYTLSAAPDRLGQLVPSDPRQSRAALWEQYQAQGYLWLKGFLDRDAVLAFRRRYFEAFRDTGLLAPQTDPEAGIYSHGAIDNAAMHKRLMEFVRSAAFEAFCLATPIWQFYEAFLEGPVYLHKRKIIRHTRPSDLAATGAHYDLIYLRGGTDRVCTSWMPIGDVPASMGGLVYLEGSDQWGRAMEADFAAHRAELAPEERISAYNKYMAANGGVTKDLPALAERVDGRWLVADYEAGDMVVHSSYMIHAATMNADPQSRIRLSADIRYQRVRDEIDARWANHWSLDDML